MSEPIKYMSVAEFREKGYLQEVNRRLLHLCGIALSVTIDDDGTESFGPIWDYRDDPEGLVFGEYSQQKVWKVDQEITRHQITRLTNFGFVVQCRQLPASWQPQQRETLVDKMNEDMQNEIDRDKE